MASTDNKRKDSKKKGTGGGVKKKTASSSKRTIKKKTTQKVKPQVKTAEDFNTPFMKKMIIVTVLLSLLAVGLAVFSYMKIKGINFNDMF